MKAENFVYALNRTANPDLTPAIRGMTFRRAKKAGWEGDGSPFSLRQQWQHIVCVAKQQAREYWG